MTDVTEKILEWFKNVMSPHCPNCNAELDAYAFYDGQGAFRICRECGKEVREWLKNDCILN